MRVVKNCAGADDIISNLIMFCNEDGKNTSFEISAGGEIEDSIILQEENRYPYGYGLIVLSSKIDSGLIGRRDVVFLGLSNYSKEAITALDADNIRYFTMKKIMDISLGEAAGLAMESAISFDRLCLSINLDILDKTFSPDGIVGGMTTRELIYCIQRIKMMKNLRTVEICGENKEIIAKLVKEIA